MDLMRETKLTFTRYEEGDVDDSGRWVESVSSEIVAWGSLQPLDKGEISKVVPEGVKVTSAFWFLTETELRVADPLNQISADETIIKGNKFEVFDSADSTFTQMIDMGHYEFLLIRRDKRNGD